jgi:phosphomannomutase
MTEPSTEPVHRAAARAWLAGDPDPQSRAELETLLERGDDLELAERMGAGLEFGTAGLRGIVGAGSNRMNRAVVIRTTRALADYLLERQLDARSLPVVVGYDGRLSSRQFAEDALGVLVAAGLPVRFFRQPVPTPMVGYAAHRLSASAGIVITASHNPPEYNGYKVYGANAAQIIAPVDRGILERIQRVGPANAVPRVDGLFERRHEKAEPIADSLIDRYMAELGAVLPRGATHRDLKIVYTPLHGVGGAFVERALAGSGFTNLHFVSEQALPDGRFPTLKFPNPEEPGALDLALELAKTVDADLILANDPDADRLAASVPTPSGRWQLLTGNQIGVLLADFMLARAPQTPRPLVVSSIVSSPMLGSIAARYGAHFEQTLTGFKWIWNAALELESTKSLRFVFGYEEALGYSVDHLVRDKDGISAALLLCELAASCKSRDQNLLDRLAELYREHGLWVSFQMSVVRPGQQGLAEIARAMQRAAADPPASLDGRRVVAVTDYTRPAGARPFWLGRSALVAFDLEGSGRVLVRPSGTEPKLKIYVDLSVPVRAGETISARQEQALVKASALAGAAATALGFT